MRGGEGTSATSVLKRASYEAKPRHTVVEILFLIIIVKCCQITCVHVSKDLAASEGYKEVQSKNSCNTGSCPPPRSLQPVELLGSDCRCESLIQVGAAEMLTAGHEKDRN